MDVLKNKYFKNKLILSVNIISLLLNLGLWLLLYSKIKPQDAPVMLHYNIYFGIDLIGAWYQVFLLPGSGLAIFLINFGLSFIIHKRDKVLSLFPVFVSLLAQLIIGIAGILIILLNQA